MAVNEEQPRYWTRREIEALADHLRIDSGYTTRLVNLMLFIERWAPPAPESRPAPEEAEERTA